MKHIIIQNLSEVFRQKCTNKMSYSTSQHYAHEINSSLITLYNNLIITYAYCHIQFTYYKVSFTYSIIPRLYKTI